MLRKAEKEYTVSNWDAVGRVKLEQLQAAKEKLSARSNGISMYAKWDPYDKYLLETHLGQIRKQHAQLERQRSVVEEQTRADDELRTARIARKKAAKTAKAGKEDSESCETFQRRDLQVMLVYFLILDIL